MKTQLGNFTTAADVEQVHPLIMYKLSALPKKGPDAQSAPTIASLQQMTITCVLLYLAMLGYIIIVPQCTKCNDNDKHCSLAMLNLIN